MKALSKKMYYPLLILSLVLLFNPNINLIDILPDFVAYFILAALIGKKGEIIPYFDEAKSLFKRLGIVTLIKIPAMLIMFANVSSGRDIIPLFTLVFAVLEAVWLFPAVDNAFSALFYVGERSGANSIISPFRFLGSKTPAETVKFVTYAFVGAKTVLSVLPELCMLTGDDKLTYILHRMYPLILISCVLVTLIIGIIWLCMCIAYSKNIKNDKEVPGVIERIAGDDKLHWLERRCALKSKLSSLSLIAICMLFLFDIRFSELGNVNIMPRFLFGVLIIIASLKLFPSRKNAATVIASASLYSISSAICQFLTIQFLDKYSYRDIADLSAAADAYAIVELFAVIECVFFLILAAVMVFSLAAFIKSNTAIAPDSELYSLQDKNYHRSTCIKALVIFAFAAVIAIFKCFNVFIDGQIVIIFGEKDVIEASAAPWLPTLIFGMNLLLAISAFHYIWGLKEDVELKFKEEEP